MAERTGPPQEPIEGKEFIPPHPSEQLAWLIGVLSPGAGVSSHGYGLSISSTDREMLLHISSSFLELFNYQPRDMFFNEVHNSYRLTINNVYAIGFLGDLRRDTWFDTLHTRHPWILSSQEFMWSFISGYYDRRGYINKDKVSIATASQNGVAGLKTILHTLGIQKITDETSKPVKSTVSGININTSEDILTLRGNIRLRSVHKKQVLEGLADKKLDKVLGVKKTAERKLIRQEVRGRFPFPSDDFAWFLGVFAASGTVYGSVIKKEGTSYEVIAKVKEIAESLFGLNARIWRNKKNEGYVFQLNSKDIADYLGNLRSGQWPLTIRSNHNWLLDDKSYLWKFIEGYFESRGEITDQKKDAPQVRISITNESSASEIASVLANLGITHISTFRYWHNNRKGKLAGLIIRGLNNVRLFAENVFSYDTPKETILDYYRNTYLERVGREEIQDAYQLVMKYWSEGEDAIAIFDRPDVRKYDFLKLRNIQSWMDGHNPRRGRSYFRLKKRLDNNS